MDFPPVSTSGYFKIDGFSLLTLSDVSPRGPRELDLEIGVYCIIDHLYLPSGND